MSDGKQPDPIQLQDISINLDQRQKDPSGGPATAVAVDVDPEFFRVELGARSTTFTFLLEGGDPDAKFTGFRYMNTSPEFSNWNIWFVPKGSDGHGTWPPGALFQNLEIADDGKTMTVDLVHTSKVLYLYVVEWEIAGEKFVCDPKIRNEG